MVVGEKTKSLWRNDSYRNHMSIVHRRYSAPCSIDVINLYNNGYSLRKISDKLNTGIWQVKKILKDKTRASGFQKGHIINLGKKRSNCIKNKIRLSNLGIKKGDMSINHKNKISKANKGRIFSEESKKKMRESSIKYIEKIKLNGLPLMPRIGRYENQILNNLEECFGYKILRQYKVNGYFLDGYCQVLNLAIEVDEKYHKEAEQMNKDINRQKNVIKELKCSFLRIGGEIKC